MKILITGGHITPALAVIDYVLAEHPADQIVFLGRTLSQENNRQEAVEKFELEKRGIKFVVYSAERVVNANLLLNWRRLVAFLKSVVKAKQIIKLENPDIFLSFGGYMAVPVAIAAWLSRIPIVTHEQTRTIGMANKLIAQLAKKIAISFESSRSLFPKNKVVLTGNPMRNSLFLEQKNAPEWFKNTKKPLLVVMGGNQGSKVINQVVAQLLPKLLKDWQVFHQCGKPTLSDNYLEQLHKAAASLDEQLRASYFPKEWIEEQELAWLYEHAKLIVSRAGANTVMEVAAFGVPTIFIPLANSYNQEQQKNAQWLEESGCALIIDQQELSADSLLNAINSAEKKHQQMKLAFHKLELNFDADQQVYQLLVDQIKK